MRAIASLGCEGATRAIASSMSPHAPPQQGPTPIFSAATAHLSCLSSWHLSSWHLSRSWATGKISTR